MISIESAGRSVRRPVRSMLKKKHSPASSRASLRAMQLLGRWTRLSQGHIALGAGCLCGASFGAVQPSDYDQQIVEFLRGRHPGVVSIDHSRLDRLLGVIAKGGTSLPPRECGALLDDLERSLDSFDVAHRVG